MCVPPPTLLHCTPPPCPALPCHPAHRVSLPLRCQPLCCLQDGLEERLAGQEIRTRIKDAPFVQIPLGVTEDRLVGTVDIEASMKVGREGGGWGYSRQVMCTMCKQ